MDPARVVAGLVLLGRAPVTVAFPRGVLKYVEGGAPRRPADIARTGALLTAVVGLALVVGV